MRNLGLIYAERNGNPYDGLGKVSFNEFAHNMYNYGQAIIHDYEKEKIPELVERYKAESNINMN